MISCIIIDDEPKDLKQMMKYVKEIPYLNLLGGFDSPPNALEFVKKNYVDLMFIDIDIPELSGMKFIKHLSNIPKVIFTTSQKKYARERFRRHESDFLVKPITCETFVETVNKTRDRYFLPAHASFKKHKHDFFFIRSEYKFTRVNVDDIKYIEAMRDYVHIHLKNKTTIMALWGLKKILQHLPRNFFMRVHRSYVVNLNQIYTIERSRIVFDDGVCIPISEYYKEAFHKFMDMYTLK